MKDEDDILVKDLIRKFKLKEVMAIKIMYQIRSNINRYFSIQNKEY